MSNRILITGVGQGFGYELARQYAEQKITVFGLVRNRQDAERLQSELSDTFHPIIGDVSDDSVIATIDQELSRHSNSLSMLINNAGISGTAGPLLDEISTDEVLKLVNVHCCGAIRCVQASLKFLEKSNDATIVNINSRVGSIHNVSSGALDDIPLSYGIRIAKAAQNMFAAGMYRELKDKGIVVYSVHPGRIKTRMGSIDAHMTAAEAARRFIYWLPEIKKKRRFGYFEAGASEINF
ncbi:SDR family NAD(P)-dependent oxidoreductase [Acaryochloris sp. IP29b_bin.148]|uniref:SDR family NAD(P)-dependent oxidoreductase n=1 Tax=Acaryochloris sp. IP29b_bin.148 TaxID=2969218 RepID=UPI00262E0CD3|nr:SDR family NAD(P)-dependent oxidoreductase [Acaryochloris sp. IP29b_bin.148]